MIHAKVHWWTVSLFVIPLFHSVGSNVVQDDLQTIDYNDNECGKRLVEHESLVKGGYATRPGEWPWHVALYQRGVNGNSDEFEYACGATIVHRYLILTAAHCVTYAASRRKIPTENLLLKLGRFNLSNEVEEHSENVDVSETIVHGRFHPTTLENDIAILRLKIPIIYNEFIQPACLWKRDDGTTIPSIYGTQVVAAGTVVGWGLTDEDKPATVLKEAHMPAVSALECLANDRDFFGRLLYTNTFCAGYKNGTGVCNGDSGGGMFFQIAGRWHLRGIVSFSKSFLSSGKPVCDLKKYVGFIDASKYIDWLFENTPNSRVDDPILGHPNIRLINQGDCGRNTFAHVTVEERKPIFKQYPWMAALRHPFAAFNYVPCNGALINRNYVLTTDCVFDSSLDEISVTLGDYDITQTVDYFMINDDDQLPDFVGVVQTIPVGQLLRKDELVLARLTAPAAIGLRGHVEAICLPVTPEQRSRVYNNYILTGWQENSENRKTLNRFILSTVDNNWCAAEFRAKSRQSDLVQRIIDNNIICARHIKNGSCVEPSDLTLGSPIQILDKASNRYLLYGLQIATRYCELPEQYINVSKYLIWILDNIRG